MVASAVAVSAMSGGAAMCSGPVTMAFLASTQLAARPCDVRAAATMRLLMISPVAAIASSQRGVTSRSTLNAPASRSSSSNSVLMKRSTSDRSSLDRITRATSR